MKVPCELVVWHALPAFRKEIARSLVKDIKMSQKEAAEKLGITEAAVSQYFKEKRGNDIKFDKKFKIEIKRAAEEIANSAESHMVVAKMCELCHLLKSKTLLCRFHKFDDKKVKKCRLCMEVNNE